MTPQCAEAVARAAGRALTKAELDGIENRLRRTASQLARDDLNAWRAMSPEERMMRSAEEAMKQIQAEADKKVARAQLQILKTIQTQDRIVAGMADGEKRASALVHDLERADGDIRALKGEYLGQLMNLIDAAKSGEGIGLGRRIAMFLFDTENPIMSRDLIREIYANADGSTGNKTAQKGARSWLDTIETMRKRFNSAGGDVGSLDYGYIPQPHDQMSIRGKGDPAARDKWAADTLPLLDRGRYLNEDGSRWNDAQMLDFLRASWETLASDGLNKMQPGTFSGGAARAGRGSESREIHFRDADAYLAYMRQYGAGSMYDAMLGHVGGMARNIGLVERYGPNPNTQMRLQFDMAAKADGRSVNDLPRTFGMRPQSYWDVVNGTASTASNAHIALVAMTARSIETFGKLQSAVIQSLTDHSTFFITTGFNKLPYFQALGDVTRVAFDGETRDFLTMHGVIAESMAGDLNRWASDNIRNDWAGRLSNSTMKLSLLNAWTDSLRRGFSLSMMGGLAKLSRIDWGALSEYDRWRMEHAGLTEADWNIVRQAKLTEYKGREFLTPEAIRASGDVRANEIVTKVLGMITDESEYAVLNPDLATRTLTTGGGAQRGTIRGELSRAVMQFKAFPIALISRHWRRMLDTPKGLEGAPAMANRLVYGSALMVTSTALGAIVAQVQQMRDGKDPINMSNPKFWALAAAKGGGLGFVGDMLLTDPTDSYGDAGANAIKSFAGPMLGTAADVIFKLGISNAYKAAHGKETHAGAQAISLARQHLPFVNLWYTKAAIDHAIMHSLQENLSPGYLSRMQQRAQQEFAQRYYWQPNSGNAFNGRMTGPERAPYIGAAFGG